MRKVKVEVTAMDITMGTPDDCGACPVALACVRAGLDRVSVDGCTIDFDHLSVRTPPAVEQFVKRFDERLPVEPFSFDLEYEDFDDDDAVLS